MRAFRVGWSSTCGYNTGEHGIWANADLHAKAQANEEAIVDMATFSKNQHSIAKRTSSYANKFGGITPASMWLWPRQSVGAASTSMPLVRWWNGSRLCPSTIWYSREC